MFLAGIITEDGIIDGAKAALSDRVIEDGRTSPMSLGAARTAALI